MNVITDEMWEKTCLDGHKLISSPTWREFEWKTRMRVFKTPLVFKLRIMLETMRERLANIPIYIGIVPNCINIGETFRKRSSKSRVQTYLKSCHSLYWKRLRRI